jgi:hypothetical protein
VDESSANVQTETQQPQNKQNNENSPKHVSLPPDLSKLDLMKPFGPLANDFTAEFLISAISSLVRKARFWGMPPNSANSPSGVLARIGRNHRETIVGRLATLVREKTVWKRKELT